MAQIDEIADRYAGELGSAEALASYLRNFHYRLGPEGKTRAHGVPAIGPGESDPRARSHRRRIGVKTTLGMESIQKKVRAGERVSPEEGSYLLRDAPVLELGQLAMEVRRQRNPDPVITYVVDTNPNYTNVCDVDCTFCAFYRPPGHAEAYTYSIEEMVERIGRSVAMGVTTVLMQGGREPRDPFRLLPGHGAGGPRALPGGDSSFLVGSRNPRYGQGLGVDHKGSVDSAQGSWAVHHAGRRSGNPLRSRSAQDLAQEGRREHMARRAP